MKGNKRNFSLSLWDHKDNFLCNLKSANMDFEGQSFDENFTENINGEKTLRFSIPMYVFDIENSKEQDEILDKKSSRQGQVWKNFKQNEIWKYIYNEQKIRYIEYDENTNQEERIEEFVLKTYVESRNGDEKIAECTCESLAVYELGKVGWNINFNTDYVSKYEMENNEDDLLTLDYWLKKIFYKETNLGRVSTSTEYTYLLQGKQLRNEEGRPIDSVYSIDANGDVEYQIISEPECNLTEQQIRQSEYYNPSGWTWSIEAKDERNPANKEISNVLYETPIVNKYIEAYNQYKAFSYQKNINASDNEKRLLPHPIEEIDYGKLVYVTDIKKRLFTIERSNIYNIIQELCSIFEIFAYFNYHYNENGQIDKREILFKTEAINEDIEFDFSYGKNLLSCQRSTDTNDLITKLIIPDTESTLNKGAILSIKEATGNPTGEGYLYNFQYFYDCGMLTTKKEMEEKEISILKSDEYIIESHYSKLKKYNTSIIELQKFLTPLYDRRNNLESDLLVQQSNKTAIIDNMQAIQDKIDAIPVEQQVINSWSKFPTQYNHIGEMKTIATTTEEDGEEVLYINFGRDDIIYKAVDVVNYAIDKNNNIVIGTTSNIPGFIPRCYKSTSWTPATSTDAKPIKDNDTSNFILFNDNSSIVKEIVYSTIGDKQTNFIRGIKLNNYPVDNQSFVRIRYQYAPLCWYYLLIKDYWEQLSAVEEKIKNIESQLQEIINKILINELSLNNLLRQKNEEILQFEKKYKPYIREGYWEANNYQAQISSKNLDTRYPTSSFEKLVTKLDLLKDLNLNESLSNYTYYVNLNVKATDIDIDSINIKTKNPAWSAGGNTVIPRYRGNDYEVFLTNQDKIIIGISPALIDTYKKYSYDDNYYACDINYNLTNGTEQAFKDVKWIEISGEGPTIKEKIIYITNDNILTDSIKVYGIDDPSSLTKNPLELYTDYSYEFDYIGYDSNGNTVDLNQQDTFDENIYYDYITKIILKNTNKVNKYNNFYVTYNEEATLQYLFQDAVFTSKKYAEPKITYSINVVDISSLYSFKNYKPTIGQVVPIYDEEMKLDGYQGFITSVSKTLESKEDTQITIATYSTKFEDVFQKLTATMSDIKFNESAIYNAAEAIMDTGTINGEVFQKSLSDNSYQISLGVNNEITIDKKSGITLVDQDNNTGVKLIGRGIFLTKDYKGDADSLWKTGITGEGINANALITGNIDTKNINIWNATEGQIRFMWNEQGLTAYGADGVTGSSTNSPQDFVNYDKYVRYNYEGLEFVDKSGDIVRSGLKLGWDGLQIKAQNEALNLDAEHGLVLTQGITTRLELGKFTDNLYGLKLRNSNGNITFQNDSDGNLWLQDYIKVGGELTNEGTYSDFPDAGIYGAKNTDISNQMGPRRQEGSGNPSWDSSALRFWAGPRTKAQFEVQEPELYKSLSTNTNYKNLNSKNPIPALAKFKVSKNGDIIASGIDVGGWIGGGTYLRSSNNEAVLRSGGYKTELPVLAIGTNSNSLTSGISTGQNYNFKVFNDGTLDIGNGKFIAASTGDVTAKSLNIQNGSAAGFTIKSDEISVLSSNNNYKVTLRGSNSNSRESVISAGISTNPGFQVFNDGTVKISGGGTSIEGGNVGGLTINSNSLVFTTTEVIGSTTYTYTVGLYSVSKSTGIALKIGTTKKGDGSTTTNVKPPFRIRNDGKLIASNAEITGKITANSGKIGGFTINANSLTTSSKTAYDDGKNGIFIGDTGIGLGAKFKVSNAGYLTSTSGTIGGWNITDNSLESVTTDGTRYYVGINKPQLKSTKVFYAGSSTADPEFYVQTDGTIKATKLIIEKSVTSGVTTYVAGIATGTKEDNVAFYAGSATTDLKNHPFYVTYQGKITATAGKIGGWNLATGMLYKDISTTRLGLYSSSGSNSTTPFIYVGGKNNYTANDSNTKFKVSTDGSVFFKGGIYGWSGNSSRGFVKGLSAANIYLYDVNKNPISVEVSNGLIIDINNYNV